MSAFDPTPAPVETWTAEPGATGRDPRTYLRILWRWKLLFLAVAVAVPVGVVLLRSDPPPVRYQSSTLLQVQSVTVDTSLFSTAVAPPPQSIQAAARLIETAGVAKVAATLLRPPPRNPRALLAQVKVTPDTEAGFITINGIDRQPERAADIANAFATAIVTTREGTAVAKLNRTISGVKDQLDRLAATDATGRQQLSDQLQRLRALRAAQGSNAQVIDPAVGASKIDDSTARQTTIFSIIVGLLLALGAVLIAESMDRRIRTPTELEEFTGLPLLSAIPIDAFTPKGLDGPLAAEAFHMLRGALTYFNVDRRLSSVVVTSASQQDGKTTVTTQLALAVARAGKRVIVVDADLRHPQVCARLGMVAPEVGLAALLVDDAVLADVLMEFPIDVEIEGGCLMILPAGMPPPNPSELLSSQNMRELLTRLEEQCDLVLVDTAAVLAVSDALPLLPAASGVLLVARMKRSTRDAVRRLQRVVAKASGQLLGVVATGASVDRGLGGYTYEVYAASNGGGRGLGRLTRGGRRGTRAVQPPASRS